MEALRQYILSITLASILCGLVLSVAPKGRFQGILQLICGVFLALLVIEPLTNLDREKILSRFTGDWETEGESAAAFGEEFARESMSDYIKRETEAYILDKATGFGVDLEVEVTLGKEDLSLPESAVICGDLSETLRKELETIIVENLGIAKENLEWVGRK